MSETDDLPDGWTIARVEDVVEKVPSINPEADADRDFHYVDISSIDNTNFAIVDCKPLKGRDTPSRARRPIRSGDILFSNVRTCLRNIAIVPPGSNFDVCSTGFTVLRPTATVDPGYLFRYVLTEDFINRVTPQQTGTHYPATSDRVVMGEIVPLPPLAEQKRIVAKVETLLARVNAARQRLAKVPTLLKRLRQSVLAAACSGQLTQDLREKDLADWKHVPLESLIRHLHQGWSPKCEIERSSKDDVWGVIKTTAVQHMSFLPDENKRLPDGLHPRPELELKAGDMLITRAGPRVRAGVACLVRAVRPKLLVCDKTYRFRVKTEKCLSEYLEIALNTPEILENIDFLKTGISDSGVNLTQDKFKALEVPLPPLAEQHEIVRRAEALLARADRIEKTLAAATRRVESLTQAILAQAFRGELVPTEAELARREGREYEPATALLERIRTSRAGVENGKKSRRSTK